MNYIPSILSCSLMFFFFPPQNRHSNVKPIFFFTKYLIQLILNTVSVHVVKIFYSLKKQTVEF